jgi:hypothetical protein
MDKSMKEEAGKVMKLQGAIEVFDKEFENVKA